MIENLEVGEPFGTSDHQIIRWKLVVCKGLTNKNKKVFNYFKTDYSAVRREVQDRNWQNLIGGTNVEENWIKLKNELTELRNKFVPLKQVRNAKCKWITNKVTKCRRRKIKAWKKYIKSGKNPELYEIYKVKLNITKKVNRDAKRAFEYSVAKKHLKRQQKFLCLYKK